MISSRLLTQLEDMLQLAEKQGARILAGGKRFIHPNWPEGHYFQPTLIADVKPEMDIATQERKSSTRWPLSIMQRAKDYPHRLSIRARHECHTL